MSREDTSPSSRRSAWRFSLAGLFAFMLGVAVALGWWRLRQRHTGEAVLAGASVWFAIGMLQQSAHAWRGSKEPSSSPEARFGQLIVCLFSAGIVLMLILAAVAKVGEQYDLRQLASAEPLVIIAFGKLVNTMFFFAIGGGYLTTVTPIVANVSRKPAWPRVAAAWRVFVSACGALAGTTLLLIVLTSTITTPWLVHIAIRGAQNFSPLSQGEHRFPHTLPERGVDSAFVTWGAVAAVLSLGSVLFTWLMARLWKRGSPARLALGSAAVACLIVVLWLLRWCYRDGFPALSPYLAENLIMPPPISLVLAGTLAVAASAAVGLKWTAERDELADHVTSSRTATHLLHHRTSVMAALLLGTAWEMTDLLGQWEVPVRTMRVFFYSLVEPEILLRCAVLGLVASRLWLRFRRRAVLSPLNCQLAPARFGFTWLLCLALIVLVCPVAAWSGFAILMQIGVS